MANPIIEPKGQRAKRELTLPVDHARQSLQIVLRYRACFQHLLIQILLLQGREIGLQLVFVDGVGYGH